MLLSAGDCCGWGWVSGFVGLVVVVFAGLLAVGLLKMPPPVVVAVGLVGSK